MAISPIGTCPTKATIQSAKMAGVYRISLQSIAADPIAPEQAPTSCLGRSRGCETVVPRDAIEPRPYVHAYSLLSGHETPALAKPVSGAGVALNAAGLVLFRIGGKPSPLDDRIVPFHKRCSYGGDIATECDVAATLSGCTKGDRGIPWYGPGLQMGGAPMRDDEIAGWAGVPTTAAFRRSCLAIGSLGMAGCGMR